MYKHGGPSVYEQAQELGGVFTRITRGLPFRSVANFSPCLFEHEGHQLDCMAFATRTFCVPARHEVLLLQQYAHRGLRW